MIKSTLITLFSLSLVLLLSQITRACSCSFGNLEAAFAGANVVFAGRVVKIETVKEARVGLLMKESGTLELLKNPRWEKSIVKVRRVTLEVAESFKGVTAKTFVLSTHIGDGSCGVLFKVGESYLVFTSRRQPELSENEAKLPKEGRTLEMRLKAESDEFNKQLPSYQTNICARTSNLRFMKDAVEEIRNFLKSGVWKESPQKFATRVIF